MLTITMNEDEITDKCIRLGRGQTNYNHAGNRKFREIIDARVSVYKTCKKPKKTEIVNEVTAQILEEGMKFIEQKEGVWKPLTSEDDIRRKVAHRFRDAVESIRKAEQFEPEHHLAGGTEFNPFEVDASGRKLHSSWMNNGNYFAGALGTNPPFIHPASGAAGLPPPVPASFYPNILAASGFMTHRSFLSEGGLSSANAVLRDTIRALQSADLANIGRLGAAAEQLNGEIPSTASLFGGNNFPHFPNNLPVPDERAIASQFPSMGVGNEALSKILSEVDTLVEVSTSIGNNHASVPPESDLKSEESKEEEVEEDGKKKEL